MVALPHPPPLFEPSTQRRIKLGEPEWYAVREGTRLVPKDNSTTIRVVQIPVYGDYASYAPSPEPSLFTAEDKLLYFDRLEPVPVREYVVKMTIVFEGPSHSILQNDAELPLLNE